tara:strand:+ start:3523 stop:3750 length:228 start_codon:yes stop_codon:yes gene_type:complete
MKIIEKIVSYFHSNEKKFYHQNRFNFILSVLDQRLNKKVENPAIAAYLTSISISTKIDPNRIVMKHILCINNNNK